MLDTLPDIPVPVQNNQQTDGHKRQKTNSEPEIQVWRNRTGGETTQKMFHDKGGQELLL